MHTKSARTSCHVSPSRLSSGPARTRHIGLPRCVRAGQTKAFDLAANHDSVTNDEYSDNEESSEDDESTEDEEESGEEDNKTESDEKFKKLIQSNVEYSIQHDKKELLEIMSASGNKWELSESLI